MRHSIYKLYSTIFLLIFSLSALPAFSLEPIVIATPNPEMDLFTPDFLDNGLVTVGDDLWFSISDADPYESYNVTIKDELGEIVRCSSGQADSEGTIFFAKLWTQTGVVGAPASTLPDTYLFETFDIAESALDGRTFTIEAKALNSCTTPITDTITFWADPDKTRVYFADYLGQPKLTRQAGDFIYLQTDNLPPRTSSVRVFLIDPNAPLVPDPNDPTVAYWTDVRVNYPNGQVVSVSSPDNLILVDNAPPTQELMMIVRTSATIAGTSSIPMPHLGDKEAPVPGQGPGEEEFPLEEEECLDCVQ